MSSTTWTSVGLRHWDLVETWPENKNEEDGRHMKLVKRENAKLAGVQKEKEKERVFKK